jgi:hypothetical protein
MAAIPRKIDAKGRVMLPKDFANSTITIEQLNATELRIRKAGVISEDDLRFREEAPTVLSDEQRDRFLYLLDHPPKPNAALRRAVRRNGKRS